MADLSNWKTKLPLPDPRTTYCWYSFYADVNDAADAAAAAAADDDDDDDDNDDD